MVWFAGTCWQLGSTLTQSARFVRGVLPIVDAELDVRWTPRAAAIPDPELRKQALASIRLKRFHCEGGSVYALTSRGVRRDVAAAIVAIQTISDYLDNLCDRSTSGDPADFRALHEAWMDAVRPDAPTGNYYSLHPESNDGGYLAALVAESRARLQALPSYAAVAPALVRLAGLYADLQVIKHQLPIERREPALIEWFNREWGKPDLAWWEFAAATGSTLGMFALLRAAVRPGLTPPEVDALVGSYFPWICSLHILLDYFIDQNEDIEGGDLNFVAYYPPGEADRRLAYILQAALRHAAALPDAGFHLWVVRGLPALYLADAKAGDPALRASTDRLLRASGPLGQTLHRVVRAVKARRAASLSA